MENHYAKQPVWDTWEESTNPEPELDQDGRYQCIHIPKSITNEIISPETNKNTNTFVCTWHCDNVLKYLISLKLHKSIIIIISPDEKTNAQREKFNILSCLPFPLPWSSYYCILHIVRKNFEQNSNMRTKRSWLRLTGQRIRGKNTRGKSRWGVLRRKV